MEAATLLFVIIFNISLGAFVLYKKPTNITHRLFALLTFLISLWSAMFYISIHPPTLDSTLFWIRGNMSTASMMSVGLLIFILNLPHKRLVIKRNILYLLFSLLTLTVLISQSPYLFTDLKQTTTGVSPTPGPGIILFILTTFGSLIISVCILIRRYSHTKGLDKLQLKYILTGIIGMFGLITTTIFIPTVIFNDSSLVAYGPVYPLAFAIPTTYTIVAHKLFDIEVAARRALIIIHDTIIIFAGFSLGALFNSFVTKVEFKSYSLILILFFSFFLGITNSYMHKFSKYNVDRYIFKKFVSKKKAIELLANTVSNEIDINVILRQVHDVIKNSLGLKEVSIYLENLEGIDAQTYKEVLEKKVLYSLIKNSSFDQLLLNLGLPDIVFVKELPMNSLTRKLLDLDIEVALMTYDGKKITSIVFLGDKSSKDPFTQNDVDILLSIFPQISAAIVKAKYFASEKNYSTKLQAQVQKATRTLRKQKRELQRKYQFEKDMMGIMGHELRTPLTVAKGMVELLSSKVKAGVIDATYAADKLEKVYSSILKEAELVQIMLSTSHVDNNKLNLQLSAFNLNDIVEYSYNAFINDAKNKNLNLNYIKPDFIIPDIYSDVNRVQEIVNNLVSNAVKYTDKGYVKIYLTKDDSFIYVNVEDTGIGIPKSEIDNVGKKFYRIHQHLDENKQIVRAGGTGLGLYVVKGILKVLGGELILQSKVGKGSTFTAAFPLNNHYNDDVFITEKPVDKNDMFEQLGFKVKQ